MRIEAKAFVVERRYDSLSPPLVRYRLVMVREVGCDPVQAVVSDDVPLLVYVDSETDKALQRAMTERGVVRVTLEV